MINFFKQIGMPSLLILAMQLCTYPYVLHIIFDLPPENVMGVAFFIIIGFYCFFTKKANSKVPNSIINVMLIQILCWFIYFIIFDDTSYLVRIFFIALTFISLFMLQKKESIFKFCYVYNGVLAMQACLGVIAFFLVYAHVLKPIFIHYYTEYRYLNCYGLTCSNAVLDNFMRVGGFFDEPGALAFWGILAILINKLTYDNKRIEISLSVSLLFTFSAAYFILLPIYIVCFYSSKIKNFIIIALLSIPILIITVAQFSNDSNFAYYTVERFSGGEVRSTRGMQADHTKTIFEESPIIGIGAKNLEQDTETTDNPYEILAKDGVIGFFITYLPLILVTVKLRHDKYILYGSLIMFLDYMQRPFHINEMHYFMLYFYCVLAILRNEYHHIGINFD